MYLVQSDHNNFTDGVWDKEDFMKFRREIFHKWKGAQVSNMWNWETAVLLPRATHGTFNVRETSF